MEGVEERSRWIRGRASLAELWDRLRVTINETIDEFTSFSLSVGGRCRELRSKGSETRRVEHEPPRAHDLAFTSLLRDISAVRLGSRSNHISPNLKKVGTSLEGAGPLGNEEEEE